MENNSSKRETADDMSADYVAKVSNLLSEIDSWQKREGDGVLYYDVEEERAVIVLHNLDNTLNRLYTKLRPKMIDNGMLKEIKEIEENQVKAEHIRFKILRWGKKMDKEGDIIPYYQVTYFYKVYKSILIEKQNLLNIVLEKRGLTAKEIEKSRRFG